MKVFTVGYKPHPVRGILAGMAGGLVASWVMNEFLLGAEKIEESVESPQAKQARQQEPGGEDATQKVAGAVAKVATGKSLSKEDKKTGGPIVHYAFGAMMGGAYGLLAECWPASRIGFGTAFGTALFLGADEVMVPLLGLGNKPTEEPVGGQVQHWLAHVVYGATVEAVRRGARKFL